MTQQVESKAFMLSKQRSLETYDRRCPCAWHKQDESMMAPFSTTSRVTFPSLICEGTFGWLPYKHLLREGFNNKCEDVFRVLVVSQHPREEVHQFRLALITVIFFFSPLSPLKGPKIRSVAARQNSGNLPVGPFCFLLAPLNASFFLFSYSRFL